MTNWHEAFLEQCGESCEGTAVGEGAFEPGPALWLGKRDIAHFDDERTLDVRLTKAEIRRRRVELEQDERVTLRPKASDWVELTIASEDDAEWAAGIVFAAVDANRPTAPAGLPPTGGDLERRRRFH